MSDETERKAKAGTSIGAWVLIGVLLLVVGAVITTGGGDEETLGAFVMAVGGVFLSVGVIAKAVEVGIRSARD